MCGLYITNMEDLTLNEIKVIVEKALAFKIAGKVAREKYRKSEGGRTAHNRSNRRTYYKKKIASLAGVSDLTVKQDKQKKKWQGILDAV